MYLSGLAFHALRSDSAINFYFNHLFSTISSGIEEMNNEFCFCQLDFKAKFEQSRDGLIWIRETSSYAYECTAFKVPIQFEESSLRNALLMALQYPLLEVSCRV